jgi:lipopolysaccharide export system permease protein
VFKGGLPTFRGAVVMKTLHTYLTRQVIASLLVTVAVFTFVLLLGNVLREILSLLVNRQATLGAVTEAIGLLILYVWAFALPMGMLTATLLIFGRFSADQELTAVRASGISLLSLITPILLLSLALCAVSAMLNMEVAPRCRVAYKDLVNRMKLELTKIQLPEGRFIKDFPGYIFYVGKNRRGSLEDVIVFVLKDQTNKVTSIHARSGKVEVDNESKTVLVHLYDAKTISDTGGTGSGNITFPLNLPEQKNDSPSISDMTFLQLCEELNTLQQYLALQSPVLTNMTPQQLQAKKKELQRNRNDLASPVRFQIHKQVSFSFACFGFTLVGIPLGIRMHRRETNIGIALALILVAVYYSFILVAQSLQTKPEYAPHLIVWLPNFVFQGVGAVLLWRANRGI